MRQRVIRKLRNGQWLSFEGVSEIVTAHAPNEAGDAVRKAAKLARAGKYAAGFVCYEAASGFDQSLKTKSCINTPLPLVWFCLFDRVMPINLPESSIEPATLSIDPKPDTSKEQFNEAINKIKGYIAAGNTYQVNYTIRLKFDLKHHPFDLFCAIATGSNAEYCWYIETDDFAVCSFSPELFFDFKQGCITAKPVKGTIARANTYKEDLTARENLSRSIKDKAENVMIVDMLRNDLGKIALAGSVEVPRLFEIEKYPTLYQLSSTVTAKTDFNADEVFCQIFPCASITGAPKCKTMEIITSLEKSPRGLYTGSIGCFAPNGDADFNVAIRTLSIDKQNKKAVYGTGGGIVWDSTASSEYDECMTKAKVLTATASKEFALLESIKWNKEEGFTLLELHLKRMRQSAEYFDFCYNESEIIKALELIIKNRNNNDYKIRLLLQKNGEIKTEAAAIKKTKSPMKLSISNNCINSNNVFLYHKTTNREVYENARLLNKDADEVLLYNENYEITECSYHNIALEQNGKLFTPPVECGLLAGTLREKMLTDGKLIERKISLHSINEYEKIYLLNSVRGVVEANF